MKAGVAPASETARTLGTVRPEFAAAISRRQRASLSKRPAGACAFHFAKNGPKVGTTLDVLVETVDPLGRSAVGRTEHDAPEVDGHVRVAPVPKGLKPGRFLRVLVTASEGYDLVAVPAAAEGIAEAAPAGR